MLLKKYKNLGISFLVAGAMVLGGLSFFQPAKVFAEETTLPTNFEYSMQDMGLTVGHQGLTLLCWAYTSSKVLETLVYNATTPNTAINISEDWIGLAYMYYVNDENQTLTTDESPDNADYTFGLTGIPHFFTRVVNAYGIMLEEDFTLTESVTTENFKELFEASQPSAHKDIVTNIQPLWAGNIETQDGKLQYQNQDDVVGIIKNYLVNYGAVFTAIGSITGGAEYNYVFHETNATLSHAMTIIGYDDEKQIDVGGEVKTGAFTLLNSYGDYRQIVYMPYEMMAPNVQNNKETNKVLSNTYVFNVEFYTGDDSSNTDTPTDPVEPDTPTDPVEPDEPTNPDEPTEPDTPTDPVEPDEPTEPDNPTDPDAPSTDDPSTPIVPDDPTDTPSNPNDDISGGGSGTTTGQNTMGEILDNLLGRYEEKSDGEKVIVVFALIAVIALLGTGAGFGVMALIGRAKTASVQQAAFGNSVQRYRQHQLELQKQKEELENEIAQMRAEAKKRKQRRLKREFRKNLENKDIQN